MKALLFTALILCSVSAGAQKLTDVISLWPNGTPTNNEITAQEEDHVQYVTNVSKAVLTVYVPENPNGIAVLELPGGGYSAVWLGTEGHNKKDWYMEHGYTYAVLKYRLPNGHCEVPLDDVHEAMRILKADKKKYGFEKLGISGCSAGGHLAATAATHYYTREQRPDFQILFYPVISFDESFSHLQTRQNLLGNDLSEERIILYSNEKQVTEDTPPALIFASSDDELVPVRNSIEYYYAVISKKVPAALHLYPVGGHGWFGHEDFDYKYQWLDEMDRWIKLLKF